MAYQMRVAGERIRFAIKAMDKIGTGPISVQEISFQLLDALEKAGDNRPPLSSRLSTSQRIGERQRIEGEGMNGADVAEALVIIIPKSDHTGTGYDRLLRAAEVQRELSVSRATAYRMMTDGILPTYRFGGRNGRRAMIRVSQKELRAWIAAHRAVSSSAA